MQAGGCGALLCRAGTQRLLELVARGVPAARVGVYTVNVCTELGGAVPLHCGERGLHIQRDSCLAARRSGQKHGEDNERKLGLITGWLCTTSNHYKTKFLKFGKDPQHTPICQPHTYKMTTSGEKGNAIQPAASHRAAPGLQVSSSSRSLRLRRATRTGWHGSGARSTAQTGRGPALSHPHPPNPPSPPAGRSGRAAH